MSPAAVMFAGLELEQVLHLVVVPVGVIGLLWLQLWATNWILQRLYRRLNRGKNIEL